MEAQRRNYLLTGETSPDNWQKARHLLAELGLDLRAVAPEDRPPFAAENGNGNVATLPYHLAEITDPEQYVSLEHFHEFWPTYTDQLDRAGAKVPNKSHVVEWAFVLITQPTTHDRGAGRAQVLRRLNLQVAARHDEGFGFTKRSWRDYVVEAGSLLNFVESYGDLPAEQRIVALDRDRFNFLVQLSNRLDQQLAPAHHRRR